MQARLPSTSEFGSMKTNHEHPLSQIHISHHDLDDAEAETQTRRRSSTVGSLGFASSDGGSGTGFTPSLDLMRSQFDDSDDEEKLDGVPYSIAKVSNMARIAAIGTASRLFKGKRHSRALSNAASLKSGVQDRPVPLALDERIGKQGDLSVVSPTVGSVISPVPRQAIFGHRPSPSELSCSSKMEKGRIVASSDRDLILGLRGRASKFRSKPEEHNKMHDGRSDQSRTTHVRQASASATSDNAGNKALPPPYCALRELNLGLDVDLPGSDLFSAPQHYARSPPEITSTMPDMERHHASKQIPRQGPRAERSAWEAMLHSPPSTVSEHSSLSSCGPAQRREGECDSSRKRFLKIQNLPPQKPPPRSDLPSLPPSKSERGTHLALGMSKPSREFGSPSPYMLAGPAHTGGPGHDETMSVATIACDKPSEPEKVNDLASKAHMNVYSSLRHDSQVVLDIGGTKYVTLVSTLQGARGDDPRLLELLYSRQRANAPLCGSTLLTRRVRVDSTRGRGNRDRSNSGQRAQSARCQPHNALDESSAVEKLTSEHETALDSMIGRSGSPPSSSANKSASDLSSHSDSGTSTRRTSGISDASSWSKSSAHAESMNEAKQDESASTMTALIDYYATLSSPHGLLPSPPLQPHGSSTLTSPPSIFIDRNADLYRDILDILRAHKLPYRLQVSFVVGSTSQPSRSSQDDGVQAIKFQLRCRLHEVKDEAEWLGYLSVVRMCEQELALT